MNPYAQSGGAGYTTWMNIYETLMRVDLSGDRASYVPLLAERWETTDAKTWTFYLRKGLTFSDGSPFGAEDVIYSFNRLMNDKDSLQVDELKAWAPAMEAVDPSTLRMVLNRPNSAWLEQLRNKVVMSKTHFDKLGGDRDKADRRPVDRAVPVQRVGPGPALRNHEEPELLGNQAGGRRGRDPGHPGGDRAPDRAEQRRGRRRDRPAALPDPAAQHRPGAGADGHQRAGDADADAARHPADRQ